MQLPPVLMLDLPPGLDLPTPVVQDEDEWRTCRDPEPMLQFLFGRASVRKHRLFAVACCQRVRRLLPRNYGRRQLAMAEALADGLSVDGDPEVENRDLSWKAFCYIDGYRRERINNIRSQALQAVAGALESEADFRAGRKGPYHVKLLDSGGHAAWAVAHWRRPGDEVDTHFQDLSNELARQVPLVREVFGNPFRPVTLDPRWRTADVVDVAAAVYAGGAFSRLPILADALMDAGCDNEEMIGHCRDHGPHVRGCWVVDLILGKE